MRHHHTLVGLFASVALLTGCGGGSGGGGDMPAPAPESSPLDAVMPEASQSTAGLKKYLAALSAVQPEDREPVDLGTFAPPQADDTEPEDLG